MRISYFFIIQNLLLGSFLISAEPRNSRSRQQTSNSHDLIYKSKMNVDCGKEKFTHIDLDNAAAKACKQAKNGQSSLASFRKHLPFSTSYKIYRGKFSKDHRTPESHLQLLLPSKKRNVFRKNIMQSYIRFLRKKNAS
ncbi:hypothetical protein OnM2_06527 [Erysiphe neolycopersici]|uniref:Uncharacterized protein n=1 Tax=Erysiphe neolycopersici TaxID=212602 RepID=A0A420I072_9PEZI|nr:hypothetical protein OnM2_06527 [Erysiphe neolycopersici]